MSPRDQERVALAGLGAVGGSLALALRDRVPLAAWAKAVEDRQPAEAAGIRVCRDASAWIEEAANATIIVLAVPVDQIAPVVRDLLPRLPDESLLLHTASLQGRERLALEPDEFSRVLGTHPIAGSERSGFAAARADMFRDATVRAEARAAQTSRARIEFFWREAGAARVEWDDAAAHDELMSWVSHLPQLVSTALAAALADRGITTAEIGAGARDATRLASSDSEVWGPILRNAPNQTLIALRRLTSGLDALGDALERGDTAYVEGRWEHARRWRISTERRA